MNVNDRKRRAVWSDEEVYYFLNLIMAKNINIVPNGKRFGKREFFKNLEAPMRERGYNRDPEQLSTKFKNLKATYFKTIRHNLSYKNDQQTCPYFGELKNIFENKPLEHIPFIKVEEMENSLETQSDIIGYMNNGDIEEESFSPSASHTSEEPREDLNASGEDFKARNTLAPSPPITKRKRKEKNYLERVVVLQEEINNSIQSYITELNRKTMSDKDFIDTIMNKQKDIIVSTTNTLLNGLADIFRSSKRKRRNSDTDSD